MQGRITLGAVCAVVVGAPLAAQAQTSYYNPPKLETRGTSSVPTAGPGTVVVQVMVNKDGTFKVQRVIRSSNHGDDAAALAIAKTSTYAPASRGSQKLSAFYDFTLRFTGGGTASVSGGEGAGTGGGAGSYLAALRSGNYTAAKTAIEARLAQHPDDAKAQADLGVTDTFLSDFAGAAAAFDKAGTIPSGDRAVAKKAYAEYATQSLKSNQNDKALAAAKRAVEISPDFAAYNTLGFVEQSAGDNAAAVTDLEKARSLAASASKVTAKDRALVDVNLVAAYLGTGNTDKAKELAAEAKSLDPSQTSGTNLMANDLAKRAQAAQTAGKVADAAALYEQAAALVPAQAGPLYARAALAYLNEQPKPDNDKAKAAADKALAVEPDNAAANYAEGIALANVPGKSKDALTYLDKADAAAKKNNDSGLATAVENAIKQLGNAK